MLVDHVLLPRLRDDRTLVLAPRAVLWELAGRVSPVRVDDLTGCPDPKRRCGRDGQPHRCVVVVNDPGIGGVARDAQPEDARLRRDIAQVVAEQCGVRRTCESLTVTVRPLAEDGSRNDPPLAEGSELS